MQHEGQRRTRRAARLKAVATLVGIAVLVPSAAAVAEPNPTPAPTAAPASGDTAPVRTPVDLVPLYDGGDQGAPSFVPPVATATDRSLPKLSNIVVTYHGFGPQTRAAVEYAVGIWERMVRSSVPIRIDATLTSLPNGVLGRAGSNGLVRDFPGAGASSTYYPLALADARAGRDLYPGLPDIEAEFNSQASWYVGTDGQAGSSIDLVTAVLHEIGHGLGMTSSLRVSGGVGYYGISNGLPTIWDRYLGDSGGRSLLTGNGTTGLASRLQSNSVRFTGGQAVSANGGAVRIYSPNPFQSGSSLSHLDEATFPRGDADSLMTPYAAWGEAIHDPGDVALGGLRDIGWRTTSSRVTKPGAPAVPRVSAGSSSVQVSWSKPSGTDRSPVTAYEVVAYADGSSQPLDTSMAYGTSLRFPGLQNGKAYRFRVRAQNAAGWGPGSSFSAVAIPLPLGPFSNVDAFLGRVYLETLFRAPSPNALAARRNAINTGVDTPGETIVALMGDKTHTSSVPPTIRLYLAYFKRLPDEGGLAYWAGKARSGTSLHQASEQFSRSTEFARTYGLLDNGAFVDLVYQNVLGRNPDSGGRAYWVGKLDKGYGRGSMMIGVSESSENVRKTKPTVDIVALSHVMLRRIPTAGELDQSLTALAAGTPLATMAGTILLSSEYWDRVT